jgi:streptogramin lyase
MGGNDTLFVTDANLGAVIEFEEDGFGDDLGGSFFAAGLSDPQGIVMASSGNLFVAEFDSGNIDEIDPNGNVTPFVGGFQSPDGLAIDGNDNLYVASVTSGTISEVTPAGNVSVFASGFNEPSALAMDGNNNLFVANYGNGTISKITPQGSVSIYAAGKTKNPQGLAVDSQGNVYVSNGQGAELAKPELAANALGDFQYVEATQPLGNFFATSSPTGVLNLSSTNEDLINSHITLAPVKNMAGKIVVTLYAFNLQGKAVTTKVTVLVGVPNITKQPAAKSTAAKGGTLTLSIKASTPAKLAAKYQWYLNGKMLRNSTKPKLTVVSGVTTNTLKLSKVQPAAAGSYTVQVTNLLGTTTSSAAKVTVSGS